MISNDRSLIIEVSKRLKEFTLRASINDSGVICITGPNGSGKSTLLNIIAGLVAPDNGRVIIGGKDVTHLPPEKRGIALVTPDSYIPFLEVSTHLIKGARFRGLAYSLETVRKYSYLLGINFTGKVGSLSLGQRERVAILTAVLSHPSLLLLDEAFSNVSEKEKFLRNLVGITKEMDMNLIYVTQDETTVSVADHHYVMDRGSLMKRY